MYAIGMTDLHIVHKNQTDPRLGRQVVHDPVSRLFARRGSPVNRDTWKTKYNRIYDPCPNPNQTIGNCTGCAKAMRFNTVGARTTAVVHKMPFADKIYSWASANDPWAEQWPPTDTGSSGLAAAKAAQFYGIGGEYRWLFGGADETVQSIMDGETVEFGIWWPEGGFNPYMTKYGMRIDLTGPDRGGHQLVARGYHEPTDSILARCWWGDFRDVLIARAQVDDFLHRDGDQHIQEKAA